MESRKSSTFKTPLARQPSEALTRAATRGNTALEKKSSWPFDFYKIGEFFPVDYHYWWSPLQTQTGNTQLTMLHAVAYASDGSEFAADQMEHRQSMKVASKLAYKAFIEAVERAKS